MIIVTLVPGQMIKSQRLKMIVFQIIDWIFGKATFATGKEGIKMTGRTRRRRQRKLKIGEKKDKELADNFFDCDSHGRECWY